MDIRELAPLRGARWGELLVTDEHVNKKRGGWRTVTSEFAAELGSFEAWLAPSGGETFSEICSVPRANFVTRPYPLRYIGCRWVPTFKRRLDCGLQKS